MNSSKQFFLVLIFLFSLLSVDNAEILSTFSVDEIKKIAVTSISHPNSLHDAFYATKILESVKVSEYECDCAAIGNLFKSATSSFDIYYGISSSKSCECGLELSTDAKATLLKASKVGSRHVLD